MISHAKRICKGNAVSFSLETTIHVLSEKSEKRRVLQRIERPSWLISGEKGKCYIDNGKAHLDSSYMLAVDIKKFYDNCRRDKVYRFFVDRMRTAPDVAKILTDIVTFANGIPNQKLKYELQKRKHAETIVCKRDAH